MVSGLKVGVIGLGYVGLPLAVVSGKKYDTIGFDISESRIAELQKGQDKTREVEPHEIQEATGLRFTSRSVSYTHLTLPTKRIV